MKKNVGLLMYLLGAMVLWLLIPATVHAESAKELYCLFNPVSGEYLYTVDENEKASLESAWYLEGVVGKLPSESSMPIYRLYNPASGLHLYTADPAEISKLTGEGWTNENVAFYVAEENAAPIYRLFDPKTGEHAFGSDATAAKMEQNGWTREGVAFYATWANNDLTYTGKKTEEATTTFTFTAASGAISPTNDFYVIRGENLDMYFYSPLYQRSSQEVKAQIDAVQTEMMNRFRKWLDEQYGPGVGEFWTIWEPLGKWNGIEIECWTIDNVTVNGQVIKRVSDAFRDPVW